MKQLKLLLALALYSGLTSSLHSNADDTFAEMRKNTNLWLKHPELHPNVVKGTECRNAIKNGTASLEQQAVIKYLDLCKESTTGRDNYRRALVAAQYNLTQEECQK